jgi:endonuclease YncB( thermonuclease family)
MKMFLLLCCLFASTASCNDAKLDSSHKLYGKVIGIVDGDTFDLLVNKNEIRVRLNGIDCPERRQPFYQQSKNALSELIFGKEVVVHSKGKDRYKRIIGDVYAGNTFVNERMVALGYAWHFKKYSKDQRLSSLEKEARQKQIGLWSHPDPVEPWQYRSKRR